MWDERALPALTTRQMHSRLSVFKLTRHTCPHALSLANNKHFPSLHMHMHTYTCAHIQTHIAHMHTCTCVYAHHTLQCGIGYPVINQDFQAWVSILFEAAYAFALVASHDPHPPLTLHSLSPLHLRHIITITSSFQSLSPLRSPL